MTTARVPHPPASAERLANAWRAAPATLRFILRVEQASRNSRDIVDGLILAAIQSANVAGINADADLQVRYARMRHAPPDELRRPVSINAIAHSLRMPFETARRRVRAMAALGILEAGAKGVRVSAFVLASPMFTDAVVRRHHKLQAFYAELNAMGVLPAREAPAAVPAWEDPPYRLTNRLVWEYMLRVTDDLGATIGDTTSGLILLAMAYENTQDLTLEDLAAWSYGQLPIARPVRNVQLAARLNFSPETMRRYVMDLEKRGHCLRSPKGVIALTTPGARPVLDRMVLDNLSNLQRLFSRLRQFGVLVEWDTAAVAA